MSKALPLIGKQSSRLRLEVRIQVQIQKRKHSVNVCSKLKQKMLASCANIWLCSFVWPPLRLLYMLLMSHHNSITVKGLSDTMRQRHPCALKPIISYGLRSTTTSVRCIEHSCIQRRYTHSSTTLTYGCSGHSSNRVLSERPIQQRKK